MRASDLEPHYDHLRYHVRELNGEWQVYGRGLVHIATCPSLQVADMVAHSLNVCAVLEKSSERLDGSVVRIDPAQWQKSIEDIRAGRFTEARVLAESLRKKADA